MKERKTAAGLLIALIGLVAAWVSLWQTDSKVLAKVLGEGAGFEDTAPQWPGHDRIGYSDLSTKARLVISREALAQARVWADVCRLFAPVADPEASDGRLNSVVLPPLPQGGGAFAAHEVILVREWTGWKLAKVRCHSNVRHAVGHARNDGTRKQGG